MSPLARLALAAALLLAAAAVPAEALDLEAEPRGGGQSLMAVAHKVAREHPEAARQFLVNLVSLIPDEGVRTQQLGEVDKALADTKATNADCILCRVRNRFFRV